MTPSAGDPQQQKMMAFMPIMMLFVFYNMSSALVLYWTVSQMLSILQLFLQQRKDKLTPAPA
jgi:YidC/Oxa1 family membrane protein insertase